MDSIPESQADDQLLIHVARFDLSPKKQFVNGWTSSSFKQKLLCGSNACCTRSIVDRLLTSASFFLNPPWTEWTLDSVAVIFILSGQRWPRSISTQIEQYLSNPESFLINNDLIEILRRLAPGMMPIVLWTMATSWCLNILESQTLMSLNINIKLKLSNWQVIDDYSTFQTLIWRFLKTVKHRSCRSKHQIAIFRE